MYRSNCDYIPKLAAALNVIEQRMRLGEQTVVFSALNEPLDTLSRRLDQAGIPHDVLDGRRAASWRGKASEHFRQGLPRAKPVLLGGMKAMAEGNNWPRANNVIVFTYDWAWDLYAQCIDRCYRLDSDKDVNVWPIICTGTIDRKIEAMTDEKGDATELVIDGRLIGEEAEEVNLGELLRIAMEEFRNAEKYSEQKLESEWPALRAKLAEAWTVCKQICKTKSQQQHRQAAATSRPNPDLSQLPRLLQHLAAMM